MQNKVKQQINKKIDFESSHQIVDKCLDLDIYGRPVRLTFHGHDKFRTKFGAACTVFTGCFVLCYAAFKAMQMVNSKDALPMESQISYSEFNRLYEHTEFSAVDERGYIEDHGQKIYPNHFFAFGLDTASNQYIDIAKIGSFKVDLTNDGQKEELQVVPCSQNLEAAQNMAQSNL